MFKLNHSKAEAEKLAAQHPARFEVGKTGRLTARFTAEEPLPDSIGSEWLTESYGVASGMAATTNISEVD